MYYLLILPSVLLSLITLIIIEIILGIDNLLFLSFIVNKLPTVKQTSARNLGLIGAMIMRLILLFSIVWIIKFNQKIFNIFNHFFSIHDLILLVGGVFLLWKSIKEIHTTLTFNLLNKYKTKPSYSASNNYYSFIGTILQIILLDIIFSIDSVMTAIGITDQLFIMGLAIIISVIVMMCIFSKINEVINTYMSFKILALSFLSLIGFILIMDGFSIHVPKGYIYFSLFFSIIVEILNLLYRKKTL
ncbi:MAG: TerC family protein [Candidatus Dasytiphilus stammeri]